MKRIIIILAALTIVVASFGLGYRLGQVKSFFDGFGGNKVNHVMDVDSVSNRIREDYNDFIYRFISDSLFQLDRIKFPLRSVQSDFEDVASTRVAKSDWKIVRLFGAEEYKAQIYDNYKRELRDTDERLFCWEGIDNGINVQYKFSRINGLWYLTEYNDFSD